MTQINLRNFNLAQDWWKASILMGLLIGVLFTAGYAASQGAQVSIAVNIEAQILEIQERLDAPVNSSLAGMQKPYTEIISMVDSYYVRQNGTDGRLILPYSTNKTYIQQQSLGNVTTGSVYLKEITLASGLTYGSTVLVIQQYQGQLSYYSNSALIYTVKAGSLNATVLYAGILNASTNYVQTYRLLVENGTSFPSSPSSGYIFFRTDWNLLTFYNGTGWTNCTTGSVDDLTVYLLKDGSRALTGNWNVGGSYGISGLTWLNTTNINLYGSLYFNQNQAVNMTFWGGTDFPASPIAGQPFFRTDLSILYYYNGTGWASSAGGAAGPAGADAVVNGLPFSYMIFVNSTATYMVNGTDGSIPYSSANASKVIQFALGNLTSGRTWQEKVLLKGNYTLTNTIILQNYTWLELQGIVTLSTNANCDIIQNSNMTAGNNHVTIEGGIWDGNYANQGGAGSYHGIRFEAAGGSDRSTECTIADLRVYHVKGDSLHLVSCNGFDVRHVFIHKSTDIAIYLNVVSDSIFEDINQDTHGTVGWFMQSSDHNHVTDVYLGGESANATFPCQMYIQECTGNLFDGIRLDHMDRNGLLLDGSTNHPNSWNSWTNLLITDQSGANDTYDAIRIVSNSNHNYFSFSTEANDTLVHSDYFWAKVVNELNDGNNNNVFNVQNAKDYTTLAVISGAKSSVYYPKFTENSGSSVNATATTFTITHGLAGTPTFVACSFNSTQIDGWAWTATSSTITVTVHNRVTTDAIVACYWEAKYVP